jgi:heat shock protein beta
MSKKLTRKVLEMLRKLAEESEKSGGDGDEEEAEEGKEEAEKEEKPEKEDGEEIEEDAVDNYATFWENFGKSIKLGMIDDKANKSKLTKLLRFITNKSDGKLVSLEKYVENMKEEQEHIYYITGESVDVVSKSPFMERLTKLDYEVIYMTDPLDEYVTQALTEFDGHQLMSVTKEDLVLGDENAKKTSQIKERFEDFATWLKKALKDKVEKVVISNRLASSPCVLVTGKYGWTANMERIMKAQTFADASKNQWMHAKKTMEINYRHPVILELKARAAANPDDESLHDLANIMYDAALVQSGFTVTEVTEFANRLHRVLANGLDVDPRAELAPEEEFVEEPEAEASEEDEVVEATDEKHDEL